MIKLNEQNALAKTENYLSPEDFSEAERSLEGISFFADRSETGESRSAASLKGIIQGIRPGAGGAPTLRERLRQKISTSLIQDFDAPELVEGLVEFLLEVVQEDPRQGEWLGLSPKTT